MTNLMDELPPELKVRLMIAAGNDIGKVASDMIQSMADDVPRNVLRLFVAEVRKNELQEHEEIGLPYRMAVAMLAFGIAMRQALDWDTEKGSRKVQ